MPDILFPAGRMVGGNLDKLFPRTDAAGKPKVAHDGKPEMQCSFGYAIPKTGEAHWNQTAWGKIIHDTGAAAHPALVTSPAFSWKVTDGDSPLPNKKGKRPCDQTGYAGHWVIWFSQGWLPSKWLVQGETRTQIGEGIIHPGDYIQVFGTVAGNKLVPNGTPGVYLNPVHVAMLGEGERIAADTPPPEGFGTATPPAGAKPVTAVVPPQFAAPAPAPTAPAVPNSAILQVPVRTMTAKAGGATYEQFVAQGWTDAMLREQGYML